MIFLRSLLFNIFFFGWTALMCTVMLPTLFLPHRFVMGVVHLWLKHIVWIEKYIAGITYKVVGEEYVPATSCIIAAKHESAWETFKLHMLFNDPSVVLKKELLEIPIWGHYLERSGMIPIDRSAGSKVLVGMMQAAQRAVKRGRKIVIFPQGTRVPPGEKRPYKTGVAALYEELKLPIIPMALNSGVLWPRNSFIKKPGQITIEFLPPIPVGLPRDEVMRRLETDLETASERLAQLPEK
jgi:1-acyl-sn-glycerol-3-phosphate acyltransferase